jgi:hypothetical protein
MQRVTAVTGCIFGKIIQAGKGRAQVGIERFVFCLGGLVDSGPAGYNTGTAGRGSVRLEHTVRDREVGGSNPLAPTDDLTGSAIGSL